MNSVGIRSLKSQVNKLPKGDTIYINSIGITANAIEELRRMIQGGVLTPVESELRQCIVEEALPKFRSGESICPQMTYQKN
jgi:hypothetical protein